MNLLQPDPEVIQAYRDGLAKHGPKARALGWSKLAKLQRRHAALCAPIPKKPLRLLDYGCGLGHLSEWVMRHRPDAAYWGVDPLPELVTEAAKRGRGFFRTTSGPKDIPDHMDHVVCCGVFSLMGSRSEAEHIHHIKATMGELFARCRVALHVDFLDAMMVDQPQPGRFYATPWDVLALARGMSPRVSLDASYLPYEFAIHVYKGDEIERPANVYSTIL